MSHQAVRELIEAKALAVADNVNFGYGRGSDFNQIKDKTYKYIWLDPLTSTILIGEDQVNFVEQYNISLVFYGFDAPDSTQDQYKLILDETDVLVQKFLRDLQNDLLNDDTTIQLTSNNIAISGIAKQPVIKVMADVLTGWIVTFNLTVPDNYDYCP